MSQKHSKWISGIIICFLLAGVAGFPGTVAAVSYKFASPTGTPADACTYTDPCDLQSAVNNATAGGLVYVASGTYHPYVLPSDMVLLITKSVRLYGGWDGVSGPDPGIPDHHANPASIIDGEGVRQGVVIMPGAGNIVTLTGLTIRNGNATGKVAMCSAMNAAGCGGGIMITSGNVVIEHSIIEDNVAATTTDATYKTGYGGGIYVQAATVPNPTRVTIFNNIIRSNAGSTAASGPVGDNGSGGGIFIGGVQNSGDLTISENEISDNSAATASYSGLADGILIYGVHGTVYRNYIHDNNPNLRTNGTCLFTTHGDQLIVANRIMNNHGAYGLYLIDFNGTVESNIIINPDVWHGIFLETNAGGRFTTLVNNVIARNEYSNIRMSGYSGTSSTANIYQNTLDGSLYGIYQYQYAYATISNSIISHHTDKGLYQGGTGTTINVSYTLFHDNTLDGDIDLFMNLITPGDPLYVNPLAGDYHIKAGSAAIDKAVTAGYGIDFEGDDRPMGAGGTPFDVGADEFWWKALLPFLLKP